MYQTKKSYWIKHLDFILVDLLLFEAVYVSSVFLSGREWKLLHSRVVFVCMLSFIVVAVATGCYHGILRRDYYKEFLAVLKQMTLNIAILAIYLFLNEETSKRFFVYSLGIGCVAFVLVYLFHALLKKIIIHQKANKKESAAQMIIFATCDNVEQDLKKLLDSSSYQDYNVQGVVIIDKDRRGEIIQGIPVIGYRGDALEYIRKNVVDEVFLHFTDWYYLQENLMKYFQRMGITVHICANMISDSVTPNHIVQNIGGFTVISNSINFASPIQLFLKRVLDIVGGFVGVLITGIVFIIFAPIIYIQSPGPIFFKQTRVGKNGRMFKIYKFRSMYPDAEERKKELMEKNKMKGFMFKMDDDPRIIPIGKFMRATSLDEFPQFWNVLKGDMSLVGTRPPTVDEYAYYEDYHKRRLATKPGITGMWQATGRSDITDFEEVVALDSQYIENWNIGLDIKLLIKTVIAVLTRKGSV